MDLNQGGHGPAEIDTSKENAFRATHSKERSQSSRLALGIEIWSTPDRSGWNRPPQSCQTENLHKYWAEPIEEREEYSPNLWSKAVYQHSASIWRKGD